MAPKPTVASLSILVEEQASQLAEMQLRITALEARPIASNVPTGDFYQDGKKISNRMVNTLVRMGDFPDFETGWAMTRGGFKVCPRLDEWTALFPDVKRIGCGLNDHYHYDKDEARACNASRRVNS